MSKLYEQLNELRLKTQNIPASSPDFNLEKQVKSLAASVRMISEQLDKLGSAVVKVHDRLDIHLERVQNTAPVQTEATALPVAKLEPWENAAATAAATAPATTLFVPGSEPTPDFIPSISTDSMELKGGKTKSRVIKGKKAKDLTSGMEVLDGGDSGAQNQEN